MRQRDTCWHGAALAAIAFAGARSRSRWLRQRRPSSRRWMPTGDGKVSRDEHAAGARGMFQKMDANKDGKVTASEMDAAHRAIAGRRRRSKDEPVRRPTRSRPSTRTATASSPRPSTRSASRAMFDKMDANHDGVADAGGDGRGTRGDAQEVEPA